jgi:hypothetical protein
MSSQMAAVRASSSTRPPIRRLNVLVLLGRLVVRLVHDQIQSVYCRLGRNSHGVAHGAVVHGHQRLKPIPAVRSRGQPHPSPYGDLTHCPLEGHRRDMMTFVDHHKAVAGREFGDIIAPSKALDHDHDHVHHAFGLAPATTQLTGRLRSLLEDGLIAGCAIVDMEVLLNSRTLADYEAVLVERRSLDSAPIWPEVLDIAIDLQHALAKRDQYRLPIPNLRSRRPRELRV